MTVSDVWGPDDSVWKTLGEVFALPVKDLPARARSARTFAGGNVVKWLLVALGGLGLGLGILVYWLFALFPLGSYLFLRILTLPFFLAVYAVRGVMSLRRPGDGFAAGAVTPTTAPSSARAPTASAAGPPPRRSTPRPGASPG